MFLLADYYDSFSCVGGSCLNTCCAGWQIEVDSQTLDMYREKSDSFSEYVRANLIYSEGGAKVRLTEERRCPFLNSENLCDIYTHWGDTYMGDTCCAFPRIIWQTPEVTLLAHSLSCEEVLRILFAKVSPVALCSEIAEGEKEIALDTLPNYSIYQFVLWSLEMLQDTSHTFGEALAAVVSMGLKSQTAMQSHDMEGMDNLLKQSDRVLSDVRRGYDVIDKSERVVEPLIASIVDSFWQMVHSRDSYKQGMFYWCEDYFSWDKNTRHQKILEHIKEYKVSAAHITFYRKLSAAFILAQSYRFTTEEGVKNVLQSCLLNYIILVDILPLFWNVEFGTAEYFARIAHIGRIFEYTGGWINDILAPAVAGETGADLDTYIAVLLLRYGI
ncbi:MAG: flagellin lysine-N-methylase [Lachnospiraceae bacterium]|nr:flagellin lysine-N-methylase [Lachnospiraceae bacterium]